MSKRKRLSRKKVSSSSKDAQIKQLLIKNLELSVKNDKLIDRIKELEKAQNGNQIQ